MKPVARVCVYACTYVCIYVHTYVRMYVYTYVCIQIVTLTGNVALFICWYIISVVLSSPRVTSVMYTRENTLTNNSDLSR